MVGRKRKEAEGSVYIFPFILKPNLTVNCSDGNDHSYSLCVLSILPSLTYCCHVKYVTMAVHNMQNIKKLAQLSDGHKLCQLKTLYRAGNFFYNKLPIYIQHEAQFD